MPLKVKGSPNSETAKIGREKNHDLSHFGEAGVFICPAPSACEPGEKTNLGELIRALRKERGISQEELARKAQVDRTTIARVECGMIKSLSMEKLGGIAQAIGIDLKALLAKAGSSGGEPASYRGHLNQIAFFIEYPEDGFRIASLTPKRKEFFFGKIEIQPQKTIASIKLPRAEQIYLHLLDGKVLLTRLAKELLLKAGDCFIFSGLSDYEFYNPDPLRNVSALFVTYPSFLSA